MICVAYGKPYSEALAWVYVRAIDGYNGETAIEALNATAFELGRLPTPSEIVQKIDPKRFAKVTDRQEASLIAQRIIEAVARLGINAKEEKIKAMIGDVGWYVVKNQWVNICNNMQSSDEKVWFAQFRDQAEAVMAKVKAGTLNELPNLGKANEIINNLSEQKALR